ncbi:MAG: SpoIID/LytB domain-containing protein [Dysgonamonadaceae bacterium]|jgi:SpoIID/LytB domain protein|nr:SpoIID/LytB domain-containing protein [Dysgonamonadaceae bacterium]
MKPPLIEVGILAAKEIQIKANPKNASFIVPDVAIGIDFHWERKEEQEFTGELKIIRENGQLRLINILPLEDYLISVISSEMSATSSLELLKAHAVISRTWLLAQKEKASHLNKSGEKQVSIRETKEEYIRWYDREDHLHFDVCADDHCQRYQGITKISAPTVQQAVESTYGELLLFEGQICDTRFSKCCGGRTEIFENVWEEKPHPYLQSIEDIPSSKSCFCSSTQNAFADIQTWIRSSPHSFCNTLNKEALKQVLNNYDCETQDFYRWKVELKQEEISRLIRKKSGWDFGEIRDLIPVERGKSGRIIRLKIEGTRLTKIVGKELFIRKLLSESHLYSSAFVVDKEYQENDIPSKFILHGAGWGHGVGLCQIGAAMMALEGYDYKAILQHYFPKTELKKFY